MVELLSCTMAVVPTFPAPLLACLTRLSGLAAKVGVASANNSAGMQVQQMKYSRMIRHGMIFLESTSVFQRGTKEKNDSSHISNLQLQNTERRRLESENTCRKYRCLVISVPACHDVITVKS